MAVQKEGTFRPLSFRKIRAFIHIKQGIFWTWHRKSPDQKQKKEIFNNEEEKFET